MSISLRMGWLAGCAALLLFAGVVEADPIDYIFTGTGTGTLNGTAFSGTFTVTEVADTSGIIDAGGGELRNTPTSATFATGAMTASLTNPLLIENTGAPGFMGFGEGAAPFPDESLINSVFETYGLDTALSSTDGTLSVAAATFATSAGDLDFTAITALSFEATVPGAAVPEPSALVLLGSVLLAIYAIRRRVYRTSAGLGH